MEPTPCISADDPDGAVCATLTREPAPRRAVRRMEAATMQRISDAAARAAIEVFYGRSAASQPSQVRR